jgi:hypothetical protein
MASRNESLTNWFFEEFERIYSQVKNQSLAYEATEQRFLNRHNHYKYSSFNSFQVCRYRRIERDREKLRVVSKNKQVA